MEMQTTELPTVIHTPLVRLSGVIRLIFPAHGGLSFRSTNRTLLDFKVKFGAASQHIRHQVPAALPPKTFCSRLVSY